MAESHTDPTPADVVRYGQNYLIEMDGIELYRALAAAEKDDKRAEIFRKILRAEERHAQRWVRLIQTGGGVLPIAKVDGRALAGEFPGPVTKRLQDAYWALHDEPRYRDPVGY